MFETLFLISNIYWSMIFLYIVYRAVKHSYKFIRGYLNGNIKNVKLNVQWLLYLLFPILKRYIFPEKK